jgi:hypothetical protein
LFIHFIFALASAAVLCAEQATVSGVLRGPEGAAAGSVAVELALQQTPHTLFSVVADEKGEFQFNVLPAGTYTLTASQFGFHTLRLTSIQVAAGEQKILPPLRLDVAPVGCGGGPMIESLELLPGAKSIGNLSARVMRDKHHPIVGTTVTLHCEEHLTCGQTKTDSRGEFIFFNLEDDQQYTMNFSHRGFYPLHEEVYEIQPGYAATYWPIALEHCPRGNCDPKLRPRRPLVVCE